jgi:hypothetical protein
VEEIRHAVRGSARPQAVSLLSLLGLGFSLSGFGGSLLSSRLSLLASVEIEGVVGITDAHDVATSSHVVDEGTSNGAGNLELLAKDGSGDAEDLGDLLEHSLVLLLIEEDSVVKLFLNLGLGPGLLLSLGALGVLLL